MIPDFFEAITAYRAFDVHENGLLVGQAHSEPWPPYQAFVARCGMLTGDGWKAHVQDGAFVAAPVFGCDCGIHALKDAAAAQKRVESDRDPYALSVGYRDRPNGRAWGRVKLWGRIMEHAEGYRAEFGYPVELFSDDAALATKIAALYGVPCEFKALPRPESPFKSLYDSFYVSSSWSIGSTHQAYIAGSPFTVGWSDLGAASKIVPAPAKPKGIVAPPKVVGATRWQQKQYAGTATPKVDLVDWRSMLRQMVYLNPGAIA